MNRVVLAIIGVFGLGSPVRAQDAITPIDPPQSLVRVEVSGPEPTTRSGIVVKGGRVATTIGWTEKAQSVRIRLPDGRDFAATGVVSYNLHVNLVLLAVDWKDVEATVATLTSKVKADPDELALFRPAADSKDPPARMSARATWINEGWLGLGLSSGGVTAEWGGAPVINSKGEVMGLLTGGQAGATIDGKVYAGLHAVRAEFVAALAEVPEVNWPQWPARLAQIRESERQAQRLSVVAQREGLAAAKLLAEKSLELDSRNAFAWSWLSRTRLEEEDHEGALEAARKSSAIHPTDPFCYHSIGVALSRLGQDDEAIKAMDMAIQMDPKNFKWHTSKGFVLESQRRFEEALECYKSALKLKPGDEYTEKAVARLSGEDGEIRVRPKW